MKKILLFLLILIVGVFCSACINSYAVNQLNKVGMEYYEKGDLEAAASRLESSVDLDGGIYESRYNLAVVYLDLKKCDKALEQIEAAQNYINHEEPALYYIQGAANACLANDILNKRDEIDSLELPEVDKTLELNNNISSYVEHLQNAVDALEKYLQIVPTNERNSEVMDKINDYRNTIQEYSEKYNL